LISQLLVYATIRWLDRLGSEHLEISGPARDLVETAAAAIDILVPFVRNETREVVMVLALDTKSRLTTSPVVVAIGTNDSVHGNPREVFRPLIKRLDGAKGGNNVGTGGMSN
jgi:DNA repair protein RadC